MHKLTSLLRDLLALLARQDPTLCVSISAIALITIAMVVFVAEMELKARTAKNQLVQTSQQ